MSECEYYETSDDDDTNKSNECALIDAVSEINFEAKAERAEEVPEQSSLNLSTSEEDYEDAGSFPLMNDSEWINKKCHVFILSTAGKPIYSLHGSEEKLITLFSLLQAFVSVSGTDDTVRSITVKKGTRFVFLVKSPLILVGVSRNAIRSENQILNLLMDVYNQIISIVTLSHMNSIFEKRSNYDFR